MIPIPEKRFEDKLKELLQLRSRQKQHAEQRFREVPPAPPQTEPMLVPDTGDEDTDDYELQLQQSNSHPQPLPASMRASAPVSSAPQQRAYPNPFTDEPGRHTQPPRSSEPATQISAIRQPPIDEPRGQFPIEYDQKEIMDPSLGQQPAYDDNSIQLLNDTTADESLPVLNYYIKHLSHLGDKTQGRLIARASAYQSKNQVLSNIVDTRDYLMAQDDFQYSQILAKADLTAFDLNTDYMVAESIMEGMFNIRLRRSRKALNLSMFNTQRTESYMAGGQQHQEESQKIWQKVPFLGGGGGGNRY